ncbi:polysaccharide deacetylase family protein [Mesorhizobium sp. B1-1-8]|uniref:polysaccharide deacetylase family protein n=1 Tax=Mesorhizobium sp. B1-1-8 TaxID=2589976 RepID=UPI0015E4815A|nr:polysaccharide deacetylase family protein [Mesorhizobium sp. B1-1-8]UCI10741.1 polysaccharide deacetylase family protein [Mesorhizobium sp. B1-1-8]
MYHRIAATDIDPWELAVSPTDFEQQMRALARTRRVLPLREFVRRHVEGSLPRNAAAITFDDGYACNALVAGPLLETLGLPATFFLATAMLGRANEFWSDALERVVFDSKAGGPARVVVDHYREVHIDLGECADDNQLGRGWRAMQEPPRTRRETAYLKLWEFLKQVPLEVQYDAINSLACQVGSDLKPRASHRPMTFDEARTHSARAGLDISGHTESHLSLPMWDREVQLREIRQSKQTCEELSGRPCVSFAYPYGDYSNETVECAKEAGLDCALSAFPKSIDDTDSVFALPRLMMRNGNLDEQVGFD